MIILKIFFQQHLYQRYITLGGTHRVGREPAKILVETSDGKGEWNTVGVHENVIAASAMALEDAVTYGLLRQGRKPE